MSEDLFLLEEALWLLVRPVGVSVYDFGFRDWFHCRTPYELAPGIRAVARVGALANYDEYYREWKNNGILLIHSPQEYRRASELDAWYPLLADLTPKSVCFKSPPTVTELEKKFSWPVFMKGARQTSRHQRRLSIISSEDEFLRAIEEYDRDPILAWQDIVCREFVPLRPVADSEQDPNRLPISYEFRTFWWRGRLVGAGRYWWEGPEYNWTNAERNSAIEIAEEAARRIAVPFLVVDVAQTQEGPWIVIECNDGQESGYAGVSPFALWQNIVSCEKSNK